MKAADREKLLKRHARLMETDGHDGWAVCECAVARRISRGTSKVVLRGMMLREAKELVDAVQKGCMAVAQAYLDWEDLQPTEELRPEDLRERRLALCQASDRLRVLLGREIKRKET